MTTQEQIAATLATLDQNYGKGTWGYDPDKRTWFTVERGKRAYQNTDMGIPESVAGAGRVNDNGMIRPEDDGGGLLHGRAVWDPKQGKYVTPISLDKIALYGTLGALTAGTANAVMAGGAVAAPGLTTGAMAPSMTTGAAAMGGAAVPGATGAVVGGIGMPAQIIGTGINAGAQIYGSRRAGQASEAGARIAQQGTDAQLAYERERDAQAKLQWEADQKFQADKWKAEQENMAHQRAILDAQEADRVRRASLDSERDAFDLQTRREREARLAPYRAASTAALGRLGDLMGGGGSQWRSPSNVGRTGALGSTVGR